MSDDYTKIVTIPYINNLVHENDFVKTKRLGDGGFGTIYEVHPKNTPNVKLAMKVMSKKRLATKICKEMMKRELAIHKDCISPYIPKFIHNFDDDRNYYIIIEHAPYRDLYSFLCDRCESRENRPKFSDQEIAIIVSQICEALKYIHSKGYLHRDLKTENILVYQKKPWICKLSDFGHAHKKNNTKDTFGPTLDYMAPEEVDKKHGKINEKTDIWKIGILIYELIYGIPPFSEDDEDDVMQRIEDVDFQWERNIPIAKKMKRLILRCSTIDQNKRPTLDEIIDELNLMK